MKLKPIELRASKYFPFLSTPAANPKQFLNSKFFNGIFLNFKFAFGLKNFLFTEKINLIEFKLNELEVSEAKFS